MKEKKFYVVWEGLNNGVFDNWQECKALVSNYNGAKYKSFTTLQEAQEAFASGYNNYYKARKIKKESNSFVNCINPPILNSLSVDAACNQSTKEMEYQGVFTATKEVIFKKGPFKGATNNIGEFLALVHGLALLKQQNSPIPIYTDSVTAMAWVRDKKHKSIVLPTAENMAIFDLLERARLWLLNNSYITKIYKWETPVWGEIPADFGRK